jgi:hypothetical protein
MPTHPERPPKIMADDNTPAREIITPEMFRDKAESAGKKLESRLKADLDSGTKTLGVVSFKTKPYEDILNDVMTAFKTKVCCIAFVHMEPNIAYNYSANCWSSPPRPQGRMGHDLPNGQGFTIRRGNSRRYNRHRQHWRKHLLSSTTTWGQSGGQSRPVVQSSYEIQYRGWGHLSCVQSGLSA